MVAGHQSPMNIVIDDGNTRAKVGTFVSHGVLEAIVAGSDQELKDILAGNTFEHAIVSSVKGRSAEILSWLSATGVKLVLTADTKLPFRVGYKTPETLGVDRLAAASGAISLFPGRNCLVIDAGTCITYEFISSESEYLGGAISPGVRMRFEAMHKLTAKLPLASAVSSLDLIGRSTEECLQSGVMNGVTEEIRGIIARYRKEATDVQVILCGGDAGFFENIDKPSIFVAPNLVLSGLRGILMHHVAE
jgi:type III pantothenate kinase